MKRRILTLLLTLVMVLSLLPGTALAVNDSSAPAVTYADLADINGTALVPDGAGENTELTVADAVRALLLWTGMTEQQLGSFPDDYLAQARSMGMIDTDTDADAPCTLAALTLPWRRMEPWRPPPASTGSASAPRPTPPWSRPRARS